MKQKTKMSLDDLNKGNVWKVTPSELSQMIIDAKKKRDDYAENEKHYMNIIKQVFDIQFLRREEANKVNQLEDIGYEVFSTPDENGNNAIAIRKHPLTKVTDLTLENIQHLEAWEVLELINHNLGTGWKGLPLAIQDIIESAFFVDCTIMPEKIMHKEGGIIDRRKEDDYEVLEIERGGWIEGIFMKPKPKVEKVHIDYSIDEEDDGRKKRRRHTIEESEEDEEFDDDMDIEEEVEEEEEEDMDDEELKKLDGDIEEEEDDEEPDESNIQIEDIDSIDDISDEEE
ncbi:MAG: hypothetical protein J5616_00745 [Bacteroidaceae bacterium]|nr:hypothetical protein [Bacteroidaceae bacterium]